MKKLKAYACIHKSPIPKVWKNDFQTHLFVFGDKEIFALDVFESKKEALKASDGIKHLKVIPCTIIYKQ